MILKIMEIIKADIDCIEQALDVEAWCLRIAAPLDKTTKEIQVEFGAGSSIFGGGFERSVTLGITIKEGGPNFYTLEFNWSGLRNKKVERVDCIGAALEAVIKDLYKYKQELAQRIIKLDKITLLALEGD